MININKYFGDFLTFVYRIVLLYIIFMLARVCFYLFNSQLLGTISWSELPQLLKGALIFDSGSIFYINLPFLLFSLLPLPIRSKAWYQTALMWLFVVVNAAGLAINMADVFYFPYKLARIASDDFNLLGGGNKWQLFASFAKDFWYGFMIWFAFIGILWVGFKKIGYRTTQIKKCSIYYIFQTLLLIVSGVTAVVLIRGGSISGAVYPINLNDAALYATPQKTSLVLSNPFAIIRTASQSFSYPEYFSEEEISEIFSPEHSPADSSHIKLKGKPNVMLIILESIASSHIKALSDQFSETDPSYTPFLDSLIREGYIFRNAYHNGIRSIDALPSLWASIPTFKTQFLSLPQSSAPIHSLPAALVEMGYSTAFMHGAERESMSFVAFGKAVGVNTFYSREEYENERGKGDFDGQWGIWDHKFFPYVAEKGNALPQPFFATMFSLSSHHPYILPKGFEGRFPEGKMPIQRMIGYSDNALRNFFKQISTEDWYKNTIFIITADHGSGADNEKYRKIPFNNAVPLLIYSPVGVIRGEDERPAQHIDLMPTLLGMLDYEKSYFAFGKDLFADTNSGFDINYSGGVFNAISDSLVYMFNENDFVGIYNYRTDPLQQNNLLNQIPSDSKPEKWLKAFIQEYYTRVKNRDFLYEQKSIK